MLIDSGILATGTLTSALAKLSGFSTEQNGGEFCFQSKRIERDTSAMVASIAVQNGPDRNAIFQRHAILFHIKRREKFEKKKKKLYELDKLHMTS